MAQALESGARLDARDTRGHSLLHRIVMNGHLEQADILISVGADVNSVSDVRWNALHIAAKLGNDEMCKLLLRHGADPGATTAEGKTPMMLALSARQGREETLEVLKGVRQHPSIFEAIALGDVAAVSKLLQAGEAVDQYDNQGATPLHIAATAGDVRICKLLLQHGAKCSTKTRTVGRTMSSAVCFAASTGQSDVLRLFLEWGDGVRATDLNEGLAAAAQSQQAKTCKVLIEAGADPETGISGFGTVMDLAMEYGTNDVRKVFADSGVPAKLWWLAKMGDVEKCREAIGKRANVNLRGPGEKTPLMYGASAGHRQVVEYLLERGADPSLAASDGCTALHFAASKGDVATTMLLVKAGVDVNTRDNGRRTALYEAVDNGHVDVAERLLKAGADARVVPVQGKKGYGLLSLAKGNEKLLRLLREHGGQE